MHTQPVCLHHEHGILSSHKSTAPCIIIIIVFTSSNELKFNSLSLTFWINNHYFNISIRPERYGPFSGTIIKEFSFLIYFSITTIHSFHCSAQITSYRCILLLLFLHNSMLFCTQSYYYTRYLCGTHRNVYSITQKTDLLYLFQHSTREHII